MIPALQCLLLVAAFALLFRPALARAVEPDQPTLEQVEFFEKRIRPVLAERCYECHSAAARKIKGDLLLDSRAGVRKGGKSGPVIVPGHPEQSLLIKAIEYTDEDLQMPPKHKLEPEQVADLKAWVQMGAPDPRTGSTTAALAQPQPIDFEQARQFWSFQPVQDPSPPPVKNTAWPRNPIDQFILAKLEEKGLTPAPDADPRMLIRRATFDLTGLPPTPEEVEAFLADPSPTAFRKVVDRLLASRAYGEAWGRHWLDLVRYADTSGCNSDFPVPAAFKYRNYVIDAFNQDKPYDQFVREQIAGDLLPARTAPERFEKMIATGYLAISRRFGSRASEFHLTIEDTIDNLGKTVLGLSLGCARCHDHKYDPVPTADYYALYGIFSSTRYAFPGTEIYPHPKDFVPLATGTNAEAFFKYHEELAEIDDRIERLQEEKKALQRAEKAALAKAVADEDGALQVERKNVVKLPEKMTLIEVKAALEDARTRLRQLELRAPQVEKAYAVSEGKVGNARIQIKGDPKTPGDEMPRGFLKVLGGQQVPAGATHSGRLELAHWLTDPKNPLTARVMVNRLWQYHFGQGLVQTPNDFGTRGKPPTHPELLDWLACQFIASGWSIKAMHRLMLLSRVYQLSSVGADVRRLPTTHRDHESVFPLTRPSGTLSPAPSEGEGRGEGAMEVDPNNDCLWRFHRRRLSAEEVRDTMLAISGQLDRSMGAEHPFPPESEWRYTQHKPFIALYENNGRTIYQMQQRIRKHPFLEIFDGADPNATTADRPINTTPIQALFMMNNAFAHEQADLFAVRVGLAFTDIAERIDYAHRLAFARPATEEEIGQGEAYLRQSRAAMQAAGLPADQQARAALASYMRVLFSSNEFIYLD